jgi:hypothetical protein
MLDVNFFGSGAGLVLLSYTVGVIIGMILRALSLVREV